MDPGGIDDQSSRENTGQQQSDQVSYYPIVTEQWKYRGVINKCTEIKLKILVLHCTVVYMHLKIFV